MTTVTHTANHYSEPHDAPLLSAPDDDDGLEAFLEEMVELNDGYGSLGRLYREEE